MLNPWILQDSWELVLKKDKLPLTYENDQSRVEHLLRDKIEL